MQVAVIVNPVAGLAKRPSAAAQRVAEAAALVHRCGLRGDVWPTEGPGHGQALARRALSSGADLVVAWGGDGTINEVASVMAGSDRPIGIVPCGSGNGLARELRLPSAATAAFAVAVRGATRRIDAGEVDGRLFFNLAGVGFDAAVAAAFAQGQGRRGLRRYLRVTLGEWWRYEPTEYVVTTGGRERRVVALLIAVANGRQYGNGATVASTARLDDGRLDLVIVRARSRWRTLLQLPRLFLGGIDRAPGVERAAVEEIELASTSRLVCHVDGEPFFASGPIQVSVRPGALLVRVPSTDRVDASA